MVADAALLFSFNSVIWLFGSTTALYVLLPCWQTGCRFATNCCSPGCNPACVWLTGEALLNHVWYVNDGPAVVPMLLTITRNGPGIILFTVQVEPPATT